MENNLLNAKDFFALPNYDKSSIPMLPNIYAAMIDFAKMHVQEALKQASEKAELDLIRDYTACEISKRTILEAYPEENIK